MKDLQDYSGAFRPDLTFEDFSKEFLLKLMSVWQYAWLHMAAAWFDLVKQRYGTEAACELDRAAWVRVGERVNPRYAKIAKIQLNTVLDSMKCLQLPLDNTAGGVFPVEYDIKNENDVIVTIRKCPALDDMEKNAPELIEPRCCVTTMEVNKRYVVNPRVKVTALKLPPRRSPDEIACRWQYTLEPGPS